MDYHVRRGYITWLLYFNKRKVKGGMTAACIGTRGGEELIELKDNVSSINGYKNWL